MWGGGRMGWSFVDRRKGIGKVKEKKRKEKGISDKHTPMGQHLDSPSGRSSSPLNSERPTRHSPGSVSCLPSWVAQAH